THALRPSAGSRVTEGLARRTRFSALAIAAGLALVVTGVMARTAPAAAGLLPPIGVDDTLTAKHDRTTTVAPPGVMGNDLQLGGGYTAVLYSGAGHGTVNLVSNGGYSYTPNAGYV